MWDCESGLYWEEDYVDASTYGVKNLGAATVGVYEEHVVGWPESGGPPAEAYAYVVVLPNVSIGPIGRIPPGKTKDVPITVSTTLITIDLSIVSAPGATGSASVYPTSITGSTTVTVTGGSQTSTAKTDHLALSASCGGIPLVSQEFFVCAHPKDFSIVGYAPVTYDPDYGPARGILIRYSWGSDSDNPAHLDQCWGSESFSGFTQDQPPFYADGVEGGVPSPMNDGFADDERAVPLAAIHNYCTGSATYLQFITWNCHRCAEEGGLGDYGLNSVEHHISGPPWKITTTVGIVPFPSIGVEQSLP
jgi:hypothetical protein